MQIPPKPTGSLSGSPIEARSRSVLSPEVQQADPNTPTNKMPSAASKGHISNGRASRSYFGFIAVGLAFVYYNWNVHEKLQLGQFQISDEEFRKPSTLVKQEQELENPTSPEMSLSAVSIVCFLLLTLQCGFQPILVKFFMPETVVRSSCILSQEASKFAMSVTFLLSSGKWEEAVSGWTKESALLAAGVPAIIFTTQTYLNLMANQVLPPVTFSVLNQTKTLSTAFCCFVILGKPQSILQVIALGLLVVSALVNQEILSLPCCKRPNVEEGDVEKAAENKSKTKPEDDARQLLMGVLPALSASFLSGLAGALTQKTLTHHARSPHLFNIELAFFSSCFLVSTLLLGSPDYKRIKSDGFLQGWTWMTLIPIMTNAFGGILVGLVTKHLGAVVKGFAVIFGMIVSGILQQLFLANMGESVTRAQFASGCIGAASLWLHASYQPK
jgi:UDP-sugar transporter A1/2/3